MGTVWTIDIHKGKRGGEGRIRRSAPFLGSGSEWPSELSLRVDLTSGSAEAQERRYEFCGFQIKMSGGERSKEAPDGEPRAELPCHILPGRSTLCSVVQVKKAGRRAPGYLLQWQVLSGS